MDAAYEYHDFDDDLILDWDDVDGNGLVALEIVWRHDGIGQHELSQHLILLTGIPQTTALATIRLLEDMGWLRTTRVERRKAYHLHPSIRDDTGAMLIENEWRDVADHIAETADELRRRISEFQSDVRTVRAVSKFRNPIIGGAIQYVASLIEPIPTRAELESQYQDLTTAREGLQGAIDEAMSDFRMKASQAGITELPDLNYPELPDVAYLDSVTADVLALDIHPALNSSEITPVNSPTPVLPPVPWETIAGPFADAAMATGQLAVMSMFGVGVVAMTGGLALMQAADFLIGVAVAIGITLLIAIGLWKYTRLWYWIFRAARRLTTSWRVSAAAFGAATALVTVPFVSQGTQKGAYAYAAHNARQDIKHERFNDAKNDLAWAQWINPKSKTSDKLTNDLEDAKRTKRNRESYQEGLKQADAGEFETAAKTMERADEYKNAPDKADEYWKEAGDESLANGDDENAASLFERIGTDDGDQIAGSTWYGIAKDAVAAKN